MIFLYSKISSISFAVIHFWLIIFTIHESQMHKYERCDTSIKPFKSNVIKLIVSYVNVILKKWHKYKESRTGENYDVEQPTMNWRSYNMSY